MKKVVVPAAASVFSAWGMMMSDLRRDYFATHLMDLAQGAGARIEAAFAAAEAQARETFAAEGVTELSFLRYGKFRYQNQEHTTEVPVGAVTDAALAAPQPATKALAASPSPMNAIFMNHSRQMCFAMKSCVLE